jgi:hypothetical protein
VVDGLAGVTIGDGPEVKLGTGAGVTPVDDPDARPGPNALLAVTVNVYVFPLVRPGMVIGEDEPAAVMPPGDAVTVYPVIGFPPSESGVANETVAA